MAASTKSGWFTATLLCALTGGVPTGSPTTINLTSETALNIVLSGSGTTDYTVPIAYNNATPTWTNAQEVVSTTNWPTGGIALSTAYSGADVVTTFIQGGSSGAYTLIYSWTHPVTVANTTIASGIWAFQIYYPSITGGGAASKAELLGIYVGTGYTTVAGTLSITPAGGGLSALTLTQ